MKRFLIIGVGIAIFVVLLLFSMTYTVSYHQIGILSRFGQTDTDSIVSKPGLHFRLPFFADSLTLLDTRTQVRQSPLEMLQTKDGQQIVVKAFLLWSVDTEGEGPLKFYRSYASVDAAQFAIDSQFRDAISVLSSFSFENLTGAHNQLAQAEDAILERISSLKSSGITPLAVGINRLILPPKTTTAVLQRMQARRNTLAEQLRAKGKADAEAIRAAARAKRDKINAFASQRAEDIRAEGEVQAATYLKQMGEHEELAIFLAWLDAVKIALSQNTTLVLETNIAPWHLMDLHTDTDDQGIPQPTSKNQTQVQNK
jgi:membrane protease subunit HflC